MEYKEIQLFSLTSNSNNVSCSVHSRPAFAPLVYKKDIAKSFRLKFIAFDNI